MTTTMEDSAMPRGSAHPELPTTCCMSGCSNCVWIDYADEIVNFYAKKGESLKLEALLKDIDDNLSDEMIKAFVKMEIKFKYRHL